MPYTYTYIPPKHPHKQPLAAALQQDHVYVDGNWYSDGFFCLKGVAPPVDALNVEKQFINKFKRLYAKGPRAVLNVVAETKTFGLTAAAQKPYAKYGVLLLARAGAAKPSIVVDRAKFDYIMAHYPGARLETPADPWCVSFWQGRTLVGLLAIIKATDETITRAMAEQATSVS